MEEDQNPLSKPHRDRVGGLARVKLPLPAAPPVTISGGWRRGRNRECPCVGLQCVQVVGDRDVKELVKEFTEKRV